VVRMHGFHKVACRYKNGVPCPTKQSPCRLGDCSPALPGTARQGWCAAGASVTTFGGSQRHGHFGLSMEFVKTAGEYGFYAI